MKPLHHTVALTLLICLPVVAHAAVGSPKRMSDAVHYNTCLASSKTDPAAALANADAFLFMAAVGTVALCLVPIIPPTPPTKKK